MMNRVANPAMTVGFLGDIHDLPAAQVEHPVEAQQGGGNGRAARDRHHKPG
jgi:hypothetical protein